MSNLGKNLNQLLHFFKRNFFQNTVGGYLVSSDHFRRVILKISIVLVCFTGLTHEAQAQAPGSIGTNQSSCTRGSFDPAPFTSISPATGTEYTWAYSTATNVYNTTNAPLWVLISGTNSATYNAPPISETTYFVRLTRNGTGAWQPSNVLSVTLTSPAFYTTVTPSASFCSGSTINLNGNVFGYASNLVTNGDFTSGTTGFSSDFSNTTTRSSTDSDCGYRRVASLPTTNWTTCTNLASRGNVLLVNNQGVANRRPWYTPTPISVTAGTTYTFSIEASSITSVSPARLYLRVGTTTVVTPVVTLNGPCDWTTISGTYTAPTTGSVLLEVVNQNGDCTGNDYMLDNISFRANAAAPAGTWSWTGPNGFTSTAQIQTITSATTLNSGDYTVTYTSGTCSATATTTMTVKANPSVTATGGSFCSGNTIQLTAVAVDPDGGAGTWSWTGPNGFTSTLEDPTIPNATSAAAGTYTVTYTSSNGCGTTASTTTSVTISSPPVSTAGVDQATCSGSSFTMAANTPTSGSGAWAFVGASKGAVITSVSSPTTTITA